MRKQLEQWTEQALANVPRQRFDLRDQMRIMPEDVHWWDETTSFQTFFATFPWWFGSLGTSQRRTRSRNTDILHDQVGIRWWICQTEMSRSYFDTSPRPRDQSTFGRFWSFGSFRWMITSWTTYLDVCAVAGAVLPLPLARLRAIDKEAVKLRYRCSWYTPYIAQYGLLADVFYTHHIAPSMPRFYPSNPKQCSKRCKQTFITHNNESMENIRNYNVF